MKTLKTILQEVISGIKAWVDTNTVHKSGNETINGVKTFPDGIVANVSVDSIAWETITDKPSSFTPVAHTHSKADVTGLLNSNFIPSANNSYDLGSSSYQWKSVYAQSYYYNGTAWGLDKQNEWTNFQRMTSNPAVWYLRNNTVTLGSAPSSNRYIGMFFEDVNGADLGYVSFQANKNGYNSIMFSLRNSDGTNTYTGTLRYRVSTTGDYCFLPETSECDLGISTNKWKSLNGINPGALSLPDYANDVSIDTTSWNKTGSMIVYTPLISGWLQLTIPGDVGNFLAILDSGSSPLSGQEFDGNGSARLYLTYPVIANRTYWIYIKASSIITARIVPCQGNV